MKKFFILLMVMAASLLFTGCESVEMVDKNNDLGPQVAGLDYRDFNNAAEKMLSSLIDHGVLNRPDGGRYVIAISRITNETTQYIDTDQLVKKLRIELLNSGKAVVTTSVTASVPEDPMADIARDLRYNDEFDQTNVPEKGQMVAPELSLSGKIIERQIYITKRKTQIEYYFQLTLTDIKTGLSIWEEEEQIIKRSKR